MRSIRIKKKANKKELNITRSKYDPKHNYGQGGFVFEDSPMPESWKKLDIESPEGSRNLSSLSPKEKLDFFLNRYQILGINKALPNQPRGSGEFGPIRVPLEFSPKEGLGGIQIKDSFTESLPGWNGGYKKMLEIFEKEMKQHVPDLLAASMANDVKEKLAQGQSWEYAVTSIINIASGSSSNKRIIETGKIYCDSCKQTFESDIDLGNSWYYFYKLGGLSGNTQIKIPFEEAKKLLKEKNKVYIHHQSPHDSRWCSGRTNSAAAGAEVFIEKKIIDTERYLQQLESGTDFKHLEKELAYQIAMAGRKAGEDPWLYLIRLIDTNSYDNLLSALLEAESDKNITGDNTSIPDPVKKPSGWGVFNKNKNPLGSKMESLQENRTCKKCNGEGSIEINDADGRRIEDCSECDGTGLQDPPPEYMRTQAFSKIKYLNSLIKLANHLDAEGLFKESDELDQVIYFIYKNI